MGRKPVPAGIASRKYEFVRELLVRTDHGVIARSIGAVIVPIDERNVRGDELLHLLRDVPGAAVVLSPVGEAEEHIRPHHGRKTVLCGDLRNARQVLEKDAEPVFIAVAVEVLPQPHHVRLVHADVDAAGREALRTRGEHLVDERIGALLPREQDIVEVDAGRIFRPAGHAAEMGERLDAGNEFQPVPARSRIQLLELGLGIAAAQIAEVGLPLQLVHVLRIELHIGIAHFTEQRKIAFQCLHGIHRIPRAVDHHTKFLDLHPYFSFCRQDDASSPRRAAVSALSILSEASSPVKANALRQQKTRVPARTQRRAAANAGYVRFRAYTRAVLPRNRRTGRALPSQRRGIPR